MGLVSYITGKANRTPLGLGTQGLARVIEQLPLNAPYDRSNLVRSQLDPQQPGFVKVGQEFVPVALVGNGAMLQGQLALQALAVLQGASS